MTLFALWRMDQGEQDSGPDTKHWMQSGEILWLEQGSSYYDSGQEWAYSQGRDEYTRNNMRR